MVQAEVFEKVLDTFLAKRWNRSKRFFKTIHEDRLVPANQKLIVRMFAHNKIVRILPYYILSVNIIMLLRPIIRISTISKAEFIER